MAANDRIWLNFAAEPAAGSTPPVAPVTYNETSEHMEATTTPTSVATEPNELLTKFDGDELYSIENMLGPMVFETNVGQQWLSASGTIGNQNYMGFRVAYTGNDLRVHVDDQYAFMTFTTSPNQNNTTPTNTQTNTDTSETGSGWVGNDLVTGIDLNVDSPVGFARVESSNGGAYFSFNYQTKGGKLYITNKQMVPVCGTLGRFNSLNMIHVNSQSSTDTTHNIVGFPHGQIFIDQQSSQGFTLKYRHNTAWDYGVRITSRGYFRHDTTSSGNNIQFPDDYSGYQAEWQGGTIVGNVGHMIDLTQGYVEWDEHIIIDLTLIPENNQTGDNAFKRPIEIEIRLTPDPYQKDNHIITWRVL